MLSILQSTEVLREYLPTIIKRDRLQIELLNSYHPHSLSLNTIKVEKLLHSR